MVLFGEVNSQQILAYERERKRQSNLLCLKGRLRSGSNVASFELESGCLPPGIFQFKIEHLTFCNEQHSHFANPPEASFPIPDDAPDLYQPRIEVRVPRPVPLVHRRRTIYTIPYEPPTREPSPERLVPLAEEIRAQPQAELPGQEEEQPPQEENAPFYSYTPSNEFSRRKRSGRDASFSRTSKRFKRSLEHLNDFDFDVTARYSVTYATIEDDVVLRDVTIAGLKDKLNNMFVRVYKRLGNFAENSKRGYWQTIREEVDVAGGRPESRDKLMLSLPPLTRIALESTDLLRMLGFENQMKTGALIENNPTIFGYFENIHPTDNLEIISSEGYKSTSKLTTIVSEFTKRHPSPAAHAGLISVISTSEKIKMVISTALLPLTLRYRPSDSSLLTRLSNAEIRSAPTIAGFYKVLTNEISMLLNFGNNSIKVLPKVNDLSLKVAPANFEAKGPSFVINLSMGVRLAELLGSSSQELSFRFKHGSAEILLPLVRLTDPRWLQDNSETVKMFDASFKQFLSEFESGNNFISNHPKFLSKFANYPDLLASKRKEYTEFVERSRRPAIEGNPEAGATVPPQPEIEKQKEERLGAAGGGLQPPIERQPQTGGEAREGEGGPLAAEGAREGGEIPPVPEEGREGAGEVPPQAGGQDPENAPPLPQPGGAKQEGEDAPQPQVGGAGEQPAGGADAPQPPAGGEGQRGGEGGAVRPEAPGEDAPQQPEGGGDDMPQQPIGGAAEQGGEEGAVQQEGVPEGGEAQPGEGEGGPVQQEGEGEQHGEGGGEAVQQEGEGGQHDIDAPEGEGEGQPEDGGNDDDEDDDGDNSDIDNPVEEEAEAIEQAEDPFDIIQITNPEPRPSRTFPYFSSDPRTTCGDAPPGFPRSAYVIVKEAEPNDWMFERGYLALAGLMSGEENQKTRKFSLSNRMFIRNYNFVNSINIEFISTSLSSYVHPAIGPDGFLTMLASIKPIIL